MQMPTALAKHRVFIALTAIALVPALHAVLLLGRIHPDEVYQVLEPAYHRAHGYGILAWEWQQGIRNWAVPFVFSLLLKLCAAVGIENPRVYRAVLEVPQFALQLGVLWAVFQYAKRRVQSEAWALFAVAAFGLHGVIVLFAGRTMSESISASFLVLAVCAIDRGYQVVLRNNAAVEQNAASEASAAPDRVAERKAGLLAGLWLGLSVVARYGSAVVVVALVLYLLVTRKWRLLLFTLIAGGVVALGLGALDWATWGKPFHSLREYLDFNVISGKAEAQFGKSPWDFYVTWLWRLAPLWAAPALLAVVFKEKPRVPAALAGALAYFAALFYTAHKEERFLYPGLVLLAVAALPGLVRIARGITDVRFRVMTCAAALFLTLLPLSYDWPELRADQFRAITYATRGDATGLLIVNEGIWGAGGYFYIGKNIPWGVADVGHEGRFIGAMRDPRINRAVTFEDRAVTELLANGFREIHQIGRERIFAR